VRSQPLTVAVLRGLLRQSTHPALDQMLPLITELPPSSKTDAKSVNLRKAMLSLISGEESLLPVAWLQSTVLKMINGDTRKTILFILAMHSRCNLMTHVDLLGTGACAPTRKSPSPCTDTPAILSPTPPSSWQL
jgi:hypothetical protein